MQQTSPDTVAAVGELGVLARITRRLPTAVAAELGPGDDCAVVAAPDRRFVVTTDMMVHGPDFRWAWSSPEDVGWKAAATNLSDVAAMGARPTALVVALAVPPETEVGVLEGVADGLALACAALAPGCGVVGGDLSTSATFTIAVTAFGDLEGRAPVRRDGARPGDVVAVSGELGVAARGLARLFAEAVDEHGMPDAERAAALADDPAVQRQRRPVPPIGDGPLAAIAGATAMLDLSDGLAIDAGRLARASGVVLDLDGAAIPEEQPLRGGEDHGLLATFPAGSSLPSGFRVIGTVTASEEGEGTDAGPGVRLDGRRVGTGGWDPYTDWDGEAG
jgi:thiamine-monophosphate kinase